VRPIVDSRSRCVRCRNAAMNFAGIGAHCSFIGARGCKLSICKSKCCSTCTVAQRDQLAHLSRRHGNKTNIGLQHTSNVCIIQPCAYIAAHQDLLACIARKLLFKVMRSKNCQVRHPVEASDTTKVRDPCYIDSKARLLVGTPIRIPALRQAELQPLPTVSLVKGCLLPGSTKAQEG
jgi:hypothetical protein